jgi:hypothetical protein
MFNKNKLNRSVNSFFLGTLFLVTIGFAPLQFAQFPFTTIWAVNDDVDGVLQYYTLELNNIFLISCYFPYIIYYSNKIIYIHLGKEMIRMDIKHYWRTK